MDTDTDTDMDMENKVNALPTPEEVAEQAMKPFRDYVRSLHQEIAGLRRVIDGYAKLANDAGSSAATLEAKNKSLTTSLETVNRRCADLLDVQLRMRKEATAIIMQREPDAHPEFMEAEDVIGRLADYVRRDACDKREHDAAVQAAARLEAENKALHAEIERLRGKSFEHAEIADMVEVRKILLAHVQENLPAPFFGPWSTISTRGLLEAALNRTMDRAGQVLAEKVQAGLECYMEAKAMAPIAPRR